MTWLFVYGTLRSGASAAHLPAGEIVERRPAVMPGYALYGRTSPYPLAAPHPGTEVVGEAVRIRPERTSAVLASLDEYEGDEYVRVTANLSVAGQAVTAHVWVARRPPDETERIHSRD